MFEIIEMNTYKLIKTVQTEEEAKEYCKKVWEAKLRGEIVNGVFYYNCSN